MCGLGLNHLLNLTYYSNILWLQKEKASDYTLLTITFRKSWFPFNAVQFLGSTFSLSQ